ncbi:MAG TPA: hypothetical protein VGI74_21470 [Streptosporangiaceae bacterium]
MTITNPGRAAVALDHDAAEAARRMLGLVSLGAVAPESYAGQLNSLTRLASHLQQAFEGARPEAAEMARTALADIETLRRSELRATPLTTACLGSAARSIRSLAGPFGAADIQWAISGLTTPALASACRDVDRDSTRKLKTRKGTERRRRRLKAEIDTLVQRARSPLAAHVAGHMRDELADQLEQRHKASIRARDAMLRLCAEATDPGQDILGAHRFSCGPRVEVVLKAAAVRRPDLLDSDGRPTDAIWPAFGAAVADGDLAVMEDPQQAIDTLRRFLESTVAEALAGVTLDCLYDMTDEQPEIRNWIDKATARLQAATSAPEPYRVRLAQVPAAISDTLYDQVLHHIQSATRSAEPNRMQLVELTFAFHVREVLGADPRGFDRVLADVLPHASNPRLAEALGAWQARPTGQATAQDRSVDGAGGNGSAAQAAKAPVP